MTYSAIKIIYGFEGFGGAEAISKLDNCEWYGIGRYSEKVDYDRNSLELFSFTKNLAANLKNTELPPSLLQKFESRQHLYLDQLTRTRSGRLGSIQEKKKHILILLKWWFSKYQNNSVEWAFFAAPPHLGVDMVLSDYLEWKGVLIRWGYQSLFPGYYSLLDTKLRTIPNEINLQTLIPEYPECSSEELFYMKKIKPYRPSKLKWLESFVKASLGDRRYSLKWTNHSYIDGKRYCKQLRQATLGTEKNVDRIINNKTDFIYFPLHLQPEMTTSNLGGIYVDQVLAIEHLHKKLPKGWKIVVKENPKQTFQSRPSSFFERIKSLKNVVFVGHEANSKRLIKHSKIVSTITGTAGWEAIRLSTPTIIFGKAWYEGFEGVHKFNNAMSIENASNTNISLKKLADDYSFFIKTCHFGVIDSDYKALVDFDKDTNVIYLTNLFDLLTTQSKSSTQSQ